MYISFKQAMVSEALFHNQDVPVTAAPMDATLGSAEALGEVSKQNPETVAA